MMDKEMVRTFFPDAEALALKEVPAVAICACESEIVLANGVNEGDVWKQAAVMLRWEALERSVSTGITEVVCEEWLSYG